VYRQRCRSVAPLRRRRRCFISCCEWIVNKQRPTSICVVSAIPDRYHCYRPDTDTEYWYRSKPKSYRCSKSVFVEPPYVSEWAVSKSAYRWCNLSKKHKVPQPLRNRNAFNSQLKCSKWCFAVRCRLEACCSVAVQLPWSSCVCARLQNTRFYKKAQPGGFCGFDFIGLNPGFVKRPSLVRSGISMGFQL